MANNEQLYTPLCYYVDFKWDQNWPIILKFNILYMVHFLYHLSYIVFGLDLQYATLTTLIVNNLMLVLEIWLYCHSQKKYSSIPIIG